MNKKKIFYALAIAVIILIAAGIYLLNPFANKIKSGLHVISHDSTVSLFLDNQYLDATPYTNHQIQPGEYQLELVPTDPDLASYELPIQLNRGYLTVVIWKPGETAETSGGVVYELESLADRKKTEVSIVSQPDNALVSFSDYGEFFTPTVIQDVSPGSHQFEIGLVSFESKKNTVKTIAGHRLNIFAKLAKSTTEHQDQPDLDTASPDSSPAATTDQIDLDQDYIEIQSTNFYQQETEVLRVRSEPDLNSQSIGFVAVGATFPLNQQEDNWYFIEFVDAVDQESKQGWVSADYVQLNTDQNADAAE